MSERPERQTRFRGEGRPKRRLSPSPPPRQSPRSATQKASSPIHKTSGPKTRKSTGSVQAQELAHASRRSHVKETRNAAPVDAPAPVRAATPVYQTQLQSGNLDLVLQNSRQKWLTDALFEKYWTKYSRKNKEEGSVSKESMTKLSGECTMIIEPHSFKITLFSVRSASTAQTQSPAPQNVQKLQSPAPNASTPSSQSPARQLTPAQQSSISPHPSTPAPQTAPLESATAPVPAPAPAAEPAQVASPTVAAAPTETSAGASEPIAVPEASAAPTTVAQPETPALSDAVATITDAPPTENSPAAKSATEATVPGTPQHVRPAPSATSRSEGGGNTDPVIQLLAARAATDHELKSLMKIVAQGHANQEQLSVFQRHIDELNDYIQAKKKQPVQVKAESLQPKRPGDQASHSRTPEISPAHGLFQGPPQFAGTQTPRYGQQQPLFYHNPVAFVKPKPPAAPKSVLSALVFEFAEANGTRYLMPRNSILEYVRGSMEVQMSFLIVRNGPQAGGERFAEDKQYYQPVNVKLIADSPRLLDMLPKVVAPAEEVYKYMEEVMEKAEPVDAVYVAPQVARKDERADRPTKAKEQEQRILFGAPASMIPL